MLSSLVDECAQSDFPVGLNCPVIWCIEIGHLHSMQLRLQNGGTNGARHAGERENVYDTIETVTSAFHCSPDTQRSLGADVEIEKPVAFQTTLYGIYTVVGFYIQMS